VLTPDRENSQNLPGKKPTVGPTNLAIPSTFELDSYGHHDIFREYCVGTAVVYDWDGKRTKFVVAARVAVGLCLAAFAAALPLLMLE
jgi:hypothetical protein